MYSVSMKKTLSLLLAFAMVLGMVAVANPLQAKAATTEIAISNGDFENGVFGGNVAGSNGATIVEKVAYEGAYAVHMVSDGVNPNGTMTVTVYPTAVETERTLTMKFMMMIPSGSAANSVHYQRLAWTSGWGLLHESYGAAYVEANGQWYEKTIEVAVPANTGIVQVQLYTADVGTSPYIDNISMVLDGTDLMTNGGIESGVLNQGISTHNGNIEVVCTPVYGGNYAAHADKSAGNGAITTTVSFEPSASNRTMNFGFWMYAPTTANGAHTQIAFFDTSSGNWNNLGVVYGAKYVTPKTWEQKNIEIAVPANTDTLQIMLYAQDNGADFYIDDLTLAEEVAFVNHDITLSFNQVTGDGTWQFSISETPAENYYKLPAIIDGVAGEIVMGKAGDIMCVYPSFFGVYGASVPAATFVVEEGSVAKAVDPNNGWNEIANGDTYTITEKIDVSYNNGVWDKTAYTVNAAVSFSHVTGDGTWQLNVAGENIPAGYYKVSAVVDGEECNILTQYNGEIMIIYPNFFPALGGAVPTQSLEIAENAQLIKVYSDNGWKEEADAKVLVLTEALSVENILGNWKDMSQYAGVTFTELKASDLNVYKTEDQAESQCRSTFAISSNVAIGNDGWANFDKVASKVLVDGVETDVHFGMVPAGESGWGAESAFLLYIVGEGNWNAATEASSVTICAGTMIVSPLDNTKGFVFTEDFVMYKNEDGSWDTTEDPTIEKQEITIGLNTVTGDGTWQLGVTGEEIPVGYYKIPVTVDGNACNVLAQYNGDILIIYPNFFPALGGAVPAESFVIAAGTTLKAVDPNNGWSELEATPVVVTSELKIEYAFGKWYEMSKYADVNFTEIYAADLDLYYYDITRLGDYSDIELNMALNMHPEYREYLEYYGRQANLTTFGIKSTIPTLQIPNNANWATFTVIGKVTVEGAEPMETFVMQTPDSSDDSKTAMDNAFLIQFRNGFVGDEATSITIEAGTKIITKDGVGFVFVDGYTLYRDSDGNWSDEASVDTNPVNRWGLTLGDQIGVKFEMKVSEGVSFKVNGEAVAATQDGNIYTIKLAAAQMNDAITVLVNGVAQEKTYSVRSYADIILADSGYGEQTYNLVKAMLVYGGAAQNYFDYNAGNPANSGISAETAEPAGDSTIAVTDNLSAINFYGASLVHTTKTAVRFYFSGDVSGLTFQVGVTTYTAQQKGELYYIEIADINPQDIGNAITVTVSDGNDTLTVGYSPLTYIIRMYNKAESTAATKAVVKALYNYYLAAVAYAG